MSTTNKILLIDDVAFLVNYTPVGDGAGFRRDAYAALGDFSSVCLVWYGVALAVNLRQGVVNGVVHFQFEYEDVVLGLDHHVGSAKDALHLGIDLAFEKREDDVQSKSRSSLHTVCRLLSLFPMAL